MPRMPEIKVESHAVTANESNSALVADWVEVWLDVQANNGTTQRILLTRAAGEEILQQLHKVLHPWAGQSIKEAITTELDTVVGRLVSDDKPHKDEPSHNWMLYGEERGQAQGLAFALAMINNPYKPNVPETKREAVERVKNS